MINEVRLEVANPEALSEIPTLFDLTRLEARGGTVEHQFQGCEVQTQAIAWDYAASTRVRHSDESIGQPVLLAVSAHAITGKVGILIADGHKVFREIWWDEDEGPALKLMQLPALPDTAEFIVRTGERNVTSKILIESINAFSGFDGKFVEAHNYHLKSVTVADFTPKAVRSDTFKFGSVTTTESCDLSCVMCHFNGPQAIKKAKTLSKDRVDRVLGQLPVGEDVWMAATGEFFMDPDALEHLESAAKRGHRVAVLTHGQRLTEPLMDRILELGVRRVRISADSIYPEQYRKIRRGGELQKILDALAYLQSKKEKYPDLILDVSCTLLSNTFKLQQEFEEFWKDKVDNLFMNVEYYDIWRYRKTFGKPKKRVNCEIATYVVPSGHIAPCCAVMVYQHEGDTSWLPHVDTHTLKEAYDELCDQYDTPGSPLSNLCASCDWWIMWAKNEAGDGSSYCRVVNYTASKV